MHQEAGRTGPAPFRAGSRCEAPLRNRIAPTPVFNSTGDGKTEIVVA